MLLKFARVLEYSVLALLLTASLSAIAHAQTTVFLDPASLKVGAVGDSFTVSVTTSDVANLYAYEFQLFYNSAVMNGTQVLQGSFLQSSGSAIFKVLNFTDHYDSTQGFVSIICTLTGNVPGVSGSGVLAAIEFKSLALADSAALHLASVELYDSNDSLIPNTEVNGTVTIVPEFTSVVAFFALIAASLFAVLVQKRPVRKASAHE